MGSSTHLFDFYGLEVYQKAKLHYRYSVQIARRRGVNRFVSDQLLRASLSVPLNIAEGCGKFSKADRRNYFVIARASVYECAAIVDILSDEEVISGDISTNYVESANQISRMLYKMIYQLNQ